MIVARTLLLSIAVSAFAIAQGPPAAGAALEPKDAQVRQRYEQALMSNPLQDQAFDRIYESYLAYEGLDAWTASLKSALAAQPNAAQWILLGRVYARQFKTVEAADALEQAQALGEDRPEFRLLLGGIYYDAGRNADATALLSSALDSIADGDQRARVVRLLGSLYLRQGKKDEAMAAWKRLTDRDPNDVFALLELSAIYEENQMWDDAIATQRRIAETSENDPYRKCRALRAIGQALIQQEKYPEAIAAFEQALELVAPGNWLFEDLKIRLVSVYQDMGDLEGLARYVLAKLEQEPGDVEFRDLLAETYTRMQAFDRAEAEYKTILERDPNRAGTYEKLALLYERMQKPAEVTATYEKLIALFPTEPDYVRRLGEAQLHANQPDAAKQTWQRIVTAEPTPEHYAQLAEWLEEYEFPDEAAGAYEKALEGRKEKDWAFRLGALKHAKGDDAGALAVWTSVLDDASSTAADFAEVASLLESSNLVDRAEPLLRKAIEKDAQNAEYPLALAKGLMHLERAEEAAPLFDQCAAQSGNEYVRDQGEKGLLDAYGAMGVLGDKQKEWENDVEAHPDNPAAIVRLARLFGRTGDRAKSTALYERAVELDPANMDYLRTLADLYKGAKQLQECIGAYTRLIEADKDRAGGYYRELLELYAAADLKQQAIDTARKIVEIAPSNPEARIDLAQVLMTYLQYDEAFDQYRYALRLEPDE
ncbi:MAG: tetratricopeptide repeat protein, partial [Candidatus Hydrogenedentes bacterium]|nr:tetratricopeptide repeat protein [Candidatus Hydrogenedentota bacterium]